MYKNNVLIFALFIVFLFLNLYFGINSRSNTIYAGTAPGYYKCSGTSYYNFPICTIGNCYCNRGGAGWICNGNDGDCYNGTWCNCWYWSAEANESLAAQCNSYMSCKVTSFG
jgi:hypothetical protein